VSITQPPRYRALVRGHYCDGFGSDLPVPGHLRRQRINTGGWPSTGLFSFATCRAPGWTFNNCYERDLWAAWSEIYFNGRAQRELRGKCLQGLRPRAFQPICSPVSGTTRIRFIGNQARVMYSSNTIPAGYIHDPREEQERIFYRIRS
jgi:hypothetical protein